MAQTVTQKTVHEPQPAQSVLKAQRWSIAEAVREINRRNEGKPDEEQVTYAHAVRALLGAIRPRPALVKGLCELLSCQPLDLFTEEILSERFQARPTLRRGNR